MGKFTVQFKAFKSGEWYDKTDTDSYAAASSVADTASFGRDSRVIDNDSGEIVRENNFDFNPYE